jgi:hypothetical protein
MAHYNLERLIQGYLNDNPGMSLEEATERAIVLRREQHRMDKSWYRSQQRFHSHNVLVGEGIDDPADNDLLLDYLENGPKERMPRRMPRNRQGRTLRYPRDPDREDGEAEE